MSSKMAAPVFSKDKISVARSYLQEMAEQLTWVFSRSNWMEFADYHDRKQKQSAKEQRDWLRELKRRKWIETKKIGNRLMARLTEQGWQRALRDRIRTEKKKCKNGACIVVFDIPEKQRHIRDVLRLFLKECQFKQLQRSVWMTDKDVVQPLRLLLQRRRLDQWIHIVQGAVISSSPIDHLHARRIIKRN